MKRSKNVPIDKSCICNCNVFTNTNSFVSHFFAVSDKVYILRYMLAYSPCTSITNRVYMKWFRGIRD